MANGDDTLTFELQIEPPSAGASRFVAFLRDRGLEVDWDPPIEERGAERIGEIVVIAMVIRGSERVFDAAVDELKKRWPQIKAKVRRRGSVEEPPPAE
jgi:hypothetical protein